MTGAAVALGAGVGALLGLLGGGGSILAVPALVYGLGLSVSAAVPTSLLVVGGAAAVAVVPRAFRGEVRWAVALGYAAAGIPTSLVGAALNHRLDDGVVLVAFAALMAVVGVRKLVGPSARAPEVTRLAGAMRWLGVVGAGAGVGFLTGLLGVGGGFLIVPSLALLLGLPVTAAVGTSLAIIVANSAAGLAAHLGRASIDLTLAGAFAAGAAGAAALAGTLGRHLDERTLSLGFALLVLTVALGVIVSAVA